VLAEDAAHALPESEFAPTSSGRSDERPYWLGEMRQSRRIGWSSPTSRSPR
jgi:hypothetical protein